jgi:hypothetical protein
MASRIIGWIALAAAVGIIAFQVLVPPPIGLADNGDFGKIIGPFSMRSPFDPSADEARYVQLRYRFVPESYWASGFHSSETLLVQGALWLNRLVSRDGTFDIRAIGILHASLLLLAFAFLAPLLGGLRPALQAALLALAILFFCDVMYSVYHNSFYMDAGAFVFLLLTLVFLARAARPAGHGPADAWLAVLFSVLMLTAKTQHALLAVPLAVFVLWKRRAMWPRRALLWSATAAALIVGSASYSLLDGTPPGYANPCLFNIIFLRLLPTADDPSAELASLGLDDSYQRFIGMDSYTPDSPMNDDSFVQEFMRKTSFPNLALFYLTQPGRALQVAGTALEEASLQLPGGMGNYAKSAGRPPNAQSDAFAVWSTVKREVLGWFPWLYPLVFAIALWILARRLPAAGVALGIAGAIEFGLGGMLDACEVTRHLFFFNMIWDVSLFGAACVGVLALDNRLRRRATPLDSESKPQAN